MKKLSILLFLFISLICVSGCSFSQISNTQTEQLPDNQIRINNNLYELTLFEDFNGTLLNDSIWSYCPEQERSNIGAYWDDNCVSLDQNGNLILSIDYDEQNNRYISGAIRSKDKFEQQYGYYEVRCKLQNISGCWSAFWLFSDSVHNIDGTGVDGTEIDIMESPYMCYGIQHAVHFDGYDEDHHHIEEFIEDEKLYEGFHTYGLEWTPDEYIFYVDGKETWRTDYGGICEVPLYLKLTTEVGTWAGIIDNENLPGNFIVDYVKVYKQIN